MKVILLQDVKGLGKKGAVVEVAEGYGRNFLMPRGLASPASEGAMRSLAQEKERERLKVERLKQDAQALAKRLEGFGLTMAARVGEGGRLFGSITAKDIADSLQKASGLNIDKRKVELSEAIKSLGDYQATVKLHPEISARITVHVVEENR